MPLPKWLTATAWLLLIIAVYWPIGFLVLEVLWNNGQLLNFKEIEDLFLTQSQGALLVNSLIIGCGTTALTLLIGVPFAFICHRAAFRGRRFFCLAFLIPILIPPYMHAIVWSDIFVTNGTVNQYLVDNLGFSSPIDINSRLGVVVILALAYFPFITLMTVSGLIGLDKRFEEAGRIHHGELVTILRITLPLVSPYIIAGAIFVFVFSVVDFGVADLLRVRVYPVDIFIQYSALYNEQAAVLLAIPLLFLTSALIGLQLWVMRGKAFFNLADSRHEQQRYTSWNIRLLAFWFCFIVILLSVGVPVVSLIRMSGSLGNFTAVAISTADQFAFSFATAAAGSLSMVVLGFIIAHSMLRASGRLKLVMEFLTQLPFAIPPILLGIALIGAWNRTVTDWIYSSALIVVLGYIAHFIPFTIRIIYSNLQQINPIWEEAGALCQQGALRVIARITLPLVVNGMIISFFITFTLALGELGTSLLVMPPGSSTLPIKLYNYLHYGAQASVASLCILLLVSQLLLSMGLFGLSKWLLRSSRTS